MKIIAGKEYRIKIPAMAGEEEIEIVGVAYWYRKIGEGVLKKIKDGSTREYSLDAEYPNDVIMIENDDADWECSVRWIIQD